MRRNVVLFFTALFMGAVLFSGRAGVTPAAAQPAGDLLPASNLTITSALQVDLTRRTATLPLHRGMVGDMPVWFVITDASDATMAQELGVNFAPRLANITNGCPGCAQIVQSASPVLGRAPVIFQGMPDFSPMRMLIPGPTFFPPLAAMPGAVAGPLYSPFVMVEGSPVVFNAPIVATGNGPFDVMLHTNTHDRVIAIDTNAMTVDLLFVEGFADGQRILYLSFEASDATTAVLERSTFAPGLALSPFPNGDFFPDAARAGIFAAANGRTDLPSPPGQGENHLIAVGKIDEEATPQSTDVMEALRLGGDSHNILSVFPTLNDPAMAQDYSPLWDLFIGFWSPAAVAAGTNVAQTDFNTMLNLAAQGLITSQGGLPLASSGIIINCPTLAFIDERPTAPQAPPASPRAGRPIPPASPLGASVLPRALPNTGDGSVGAGGDDGQP